MLVEDHADTARVLSRLLEKLGHSVTVAHSVGEALAAFVPDRYDVLLSDVGLPDGTGIDLIKEIRTRSDLPAVALTGFGMEEDVAKCKAAGFTGTPDQAGQLSAAGDGDRPGVGPGRRLTGGSRRGTAGEIEWPLPGSNRHSSEGTGF